MRPPLTTAGAAGAGAVHLHHGVRHLLDAAAAAAASGAAAAIGKHPILFEQLQNPLSAGNWWPSEMALKVHCMSMERPSHRRHHPECFWRKQTWNDGTRRPLWPARSDAEKQPSPQTFFFSVCPQEKKKMLSAQPAPADRILNIRKSTASARKRCFCTSPRVRFTNSLLLL